MPRLCFDTFRQANLKRLPLFANKHGKRAHSKDDGSDWTPAAWLRALVGELGEYARVRQQYEQGQLSFEQYEQLASKELADVQTYLDLLAARSLDKTLSAQGGPDSAQQLQHLVAALGEYANWHKKLERGDIGAGEFTQLARPVLDEARQALEALSSLDALACEPSRVTEAHPCGVSLGQATADKFNEVSQRVGADVSLVDVNGVLQVRSST